MLWGTLAALALSPRSDAGGEQARHRRPGSAQVFALSVFLSFL